MQGLTEGVCVWCKDLMMKTEGEMVMSETSPPDVREGVKPLGKLSRHLLECARNIGSVSLIANLLMSAQYVYSAPALEPEMVI